MDIVCIQPDVTWHDPAANCARIQSLVDSASPAKGDIVVLPEMFATGFTMDSSLAEPPDGEIAEFVSSLARERGVHVVAGIATARDNGVFNDAVVFDPDGRESGRYAKTHLFNPAGEGDVYCAGDEVLVTQVGAMSLAPIVCYDLRFPELFRDAVRRGAELFTVIANWLLDMATRRYRDTTMPEGPRTLTEQPVKIHSHHLQAILIWMHTIRQSKYR